MAAVGLRILALECVRAFGPNRRWVASAYYGIGLNDSYGGSCESLAPTSCATTTAM